jgi:2,5-furandicarboxylate decarboxylase 1
LLGAIPREATLLAHLQRSFPNVRDVHLARRCLPLSPLCADEKALGRRSQERYPQCVGGHYDIKQVVVVDEDVDIHNPTEVEWAVATRFQADRDLIVVSNAQGSKLDPSSRDGVSAKMGLDATVPLDAPEFKFKRIQVPGERELDLQAAIDDDAAVQTLARSSRRR